MVNSFRYKSLPEGLTKLVGVRGGKSVTYMVKMFHVCSSLNCWVLECEFLYRNHFWKLDKWGRVYRVGNGRNGSHKMVTLCDEASIMMAEME